MNEALGKLSDSNDDQPNVPAEIAPSLNQNAYSTTRQEEVDGYDQDDDDGEDDFLSLSQDSADNRATRNPIFSRARSLRLPSSLTRIAHKKSQVRQNDASSKDCGSDESSSEESSSDNQDFGASTDFVPQNESDLAETGPRPRTATSNLSRTDSTVVCKVEETQQSDEVVDTQQQSAVSREKRRLSNVDRSLAKQQESKDALGKRRASDSALSTRESTTIAAEQKRLRTDNESRTRIAELDSQRSARSATTRTSTAPTPSNVPRASSSSSTAAMIDKETCQPSRRARGATAETQAADEVAQGGARQTRRTRLAAQTTTYASRDVLLSRIRNALSTMGPPDRPIFKPYNLLPVPEADAAVDEDVPSSADAVVVTADSQRSEAAAPLNLLAEIQSLRADQSDDRVQRVLQRIELAGVPMDDIAAAAWQCIAPSPTSDDALDWLVPFLSRWNELLESVLARWSEWMLAELGERVRKNDTKRSMRVACAVRLCVVAAQRAHRAERATIVLLDVLFASEFLDPIVVNAALRAAAPSLAKLLPATRAGEPLVARVLALLLRRWQSAKASRNKRAAGACTQALALLSPLCGDEWASPAPPSALARDLTDRFMAAVRERAGAPATWHSALEAIVPRLSGNAAAAQQHSRIICCSQRSSAAVAQLFEWPPDALCAALALRLLAAAGGWQWTWSAVLVPLLWPRLTTRGSATSDAAQCELTHHHVLRLAGWLAASAAGSGAALSDEQQSALARLRRLMVAVVTPVAVPSTHVTPPPPLSATPFTALYTPHRNNHERLIARARDASVLRSWLAQLAAADAICELALDERASLLAARAWFQALPPALNRLVPPVLKNRLEKVSLQGIQ